MLNEIHTHLLNLSFPQIITKGYKIKAMVRKGH